KGVRKIKETKVSTDAKSAFTTLFRSATIIFLTPLPIYGAGASTTVVGNAYSLTFFNILFLKMLSGGISSTVLLAKRIKRPNRRDQVEVTSKD
ncbi:hypothetical protein ACCT26_11935, partial [Rhizobium ruizarguesonis]